MLKSLLDLIKELIDAIKNILTTYKKTREEKFIADGKEISEQLSHASSDEERKKLLEKLHNNWDGMPGI